MSKRSVPTPARLAAELGYRLPPPGSTVGILGGSFNPAHDGHVHITLEALRRLGLDEVWWLVTPQNPLKARVGMAPFEQRIAQARLTMLHPRVRVTGIESLLDTTYTAQTLRLLTRRFPRVRFVWLMGADNLVQISNWADWQEIFHTVVIAIFNRPSYGLRALRSKASYRFMRARLPHADASALAKCAAPAWAFIPIRLNDLSATRLRDARARQDHGADIGSASPGAAA